MNRFYSLTLTVAALLFISACSIPTDPGVPMLEPQFGTADDDIGIDIASASAGRIYLLSQQFGPAYTDLDNGTSYESGFYERTLLRRYDSSGKAIWTKDVNSLTCNYADLSEYDTCESLKALSLAADAQGYTYVLTSTSYVDHNGYDPVFEDYAITKYNAAGNIVDSVYSSQTITGDYGGSADSSSVGPTTFAIDGSGNIYFAGAECTAVHESEDFPITIGGDCTNVIAKYSTTGNVLWQRASTVGIPSDITVSGSGSVYVVGNAGMARYSNSGGLTWKKAGNFQEVVISGSNLYTRYNKDIRKYDGTGKQLWLKSQRGLSTMVFQDMDGDGSGNVYLSGKYDADSSSKLSMNAMVHKLSSSGSVLWTKTYGTSAYDDARGIATITGSEIYVTGETQGSLAYSNRGGPQNRDGYLGKMNSSGSRVWTR